MLCRERDYSIASVYVEGIGHNHKSGDLFLFKGRENIFEIGVIAGIENYDFNSKRSSSGLQIMQLFFLNPDFWGSRLHQKL